MTRSTCPNCAVQHHWEWQDAFDKFGFDDGDGLVMTEAVAHVLRESGLTVTTEHWGMHNRIITAIEREGTSLIPVGTALGYDHPRSYLPDDIVELLDDAFSGETDVEVP